MQLSDFDYHLPPERIAVRPLPDRAASRMLIIHRKEQRWEDRVFRDLPLFLGPGDCLVLNDTRVFPARLLGHRKGFTGKVEVFLVRPLEKDSSTWLALVRPGRKMRTGERLELGEGLEAVILGRNEFGERIVRLQCGGDLYAKLDQVGHVPLPPYLHRDDTPEDRERYQTVYAGERGSVAAPTAGLHFTPQVLEACRAAGASLAKVTLHVGLGTFQPIHTTVIEDVKLHSEWFSISPEAAEIMRAAKRLCAVGTTAVRTIETAMRRGGLRAMEADTDLFISPGFNFQATGAMLTNFHLPQSSLLVLVCALAGRELVLSAYRHAVENEYRFYSYGDCMLIVD
ncbi:MAG: tRNA preQ1(34) S-adenosylmethionine ribosyltransferase-isomerase QueA [Acidobacteriia bacterium]|nr:tRNA preQ1(34) S-adenosylmethionine ribosyltransferase-isomerase QueA [Terriglobia bacterium]